MKRRTFIKTLFMSSGALILGANFLTASSEKSDTIKMLMVYNNVGNSDHYVTGWGLSVWIEYQETAVLFDTGSYPSVMWHNLDISGVDVKKLSKIVISHNHPDHVNGLPIILKKTNFQPKVYVPNFDLEVIRSKNPKAKFVGIKESAQINEYMWSTGQMEGSTPKSLINEQSITIVQNEFVFLLTGCAHPGIVEIVEKTKKLHPGKELNLVSGGFHLMRHTPEQVKGISDKLKSLQVKNIAPSHCTGKQSTNIFKDEWKDNYIDFNIGNNVTI